MAWKCKYEKFNMYGTWTDPNTMRNMKKTLTLFLLGDDADSAKHLWIRITRRIWRSVGNLFAWDSLEPKLEKTWSKKSRAIVPGVFQIWHMGCLKPLLEYLQPGGFLPYFCWLPRDHPGLRKCVQIGSKDVCRLDVVGALGCFWLQKSFWSTWQIA
jgi:hypothetical protein